jgi:hypothetical protein
MQLRSLCENPVVYQSIRASPGLQSGQSVLARENAPLRFALSTIKLQPPDLEWVAQVSLLRPGFLPANGHSRSTPVKSESQRRDTGHPLNVRLRRFRADSKR